MVHLSQKKFVNKSRVKPIISFSLLCWISYFLWIYSQISSNSSNVVFSIIILENLQKIFVNNEKIETNNWTRLLIEERESDILKKFEKIANWKSLIKAFTFTGILSIVLATWFISTYHTHAILTILILGAILFIIFVFNYYIFLGDRGQTFYVYKVVISV